MLSKVLLLSDSRKNSVIEIANSDEKYNFLDSSSLLLNLEA
jgi:hypothetical protein